MSDVLFDALREIDRYQREFPGCYDGLREEIEPAKTALAGLLLLLAHPGSSCPAGHNHRDHQPKGCQP